jgi:hypothetical protein
VLKLRLAANFSIILKACALPFLLLYVGFAADTKAAPADPCRNSGQGYINGYSDPDSLRIEDKVVSFSMGLPSYRVLSAVTNAGGYRMANIEWENNGTVTTAWVSSTALFCHDKKSPSLPPFKTGDSLERSLQNRQCDLVASSEWTLNQATGSDSRQYISHRCGSNLSFVRNSDGVARLHRGVVSIEGGGGYLSTNEGVGIGTPEEEAIREFGFRIIHEGTEPGKTLSVDGFYNGYIFRIENGIVRSIEFGNVRE